MQILWVLTSKLTRHWFDIRRDSVRIKTDPSLWADIHEFNWQMAQHADHQHELAGACARCLPNLLTAIQLYTDDFLKGFTLADSVAFDDWQFFQTDLLREKALESLKKIVRYYADQ